MCVGVPADSNSKFKVPGTSLSRQVTQFLLARLYTRPSAWHLIAKFGSAGQLTEDLTKGESHGIFSINSTPGIKSVIYIPSIVNRHLCYPQDPFYALGRYNHTLAAIAGLL
jgi:hypothetical protein